jgi:hypothetical protein
VLSRGSVRASRCRRSRNVGKVNAFQERAAIWLLAFLMGGCSSADSVATFAPKLECKKSVWCHIIEWQLGIRFGPKVSGTHGGCKCHDD